MTITSIPGLPAPAGPEGRSGAGNDDGAGNAAGKAAGGFAAFLAGLLGPAAGTVPAGTAVPNGTPGGGTSVGGSDQVDDDRAETPAEADPTAVAAEALAALLGGSGPLPLGPVTVAAASAVAVTTSAGPATSPTTEPALPAATVDATASSASDPVLAPPAATDRVETEQPPVTSATAPATAGAGAEEAAALTVRTAGPTRAGTDQDPVRTRPATSDVIASSAAAAGASGSATPAPAAGPASATPAAPAMPVLEQLSPGIARLVSRGDGEHRMSLVLHPADLGEVRVTVTVRGEHVDVEIASGAHARDLLRDGSAQLRHLLETTGRVAGAVTFRDLTATAVPPAAVTPDGSGQADARPGWGEPGQGGQASGDPAGRGDGFTRNQGHGPGDGALPGRTTGSGRPGVDPLPRTSTHDRAGNTGLDLTI